ncbi:MAG: hypothetical protein KGH72_05665 [Candidatus Micrarchaeota archaeon]|nr:hypothetical protein [Candidatus Micrarchaeota archaeon]
MLNGYERATKEIVPAVRLLIARELKEKYRMKETEIANRLGVAQAAVSKYLSGKYSDRIEELVSRIKKGEIDGSIGSIAAGKEGAVNMCICTVCKAMNEFGCQFSHAGKV